MLKAGIVCIIPNLNSQENKCSIKIQKSTNFAKIKFTVVIHQNLWYHKEYFIKISRAVYI